MTRLDDRLLNHPATAHIAELRATIASLDDETVEAANEALDGAVERVPTALTYIEGALVAADPALVTASALEGIDSSVVAANQMASQLTANPALANQLDAHIEAALDAAARVVSASPLVAGRAGEATETFDTALTGTVNSISEQAEAIGAELAALDQRRAEAEAARVDEDAARETALTAKVEELTAQVATEKQRLDSLVPNFETQFTTAQGERQTAFDDLQDELKTASDSFTSDLTKKSHEVLAEVEARRNEVEKLHGIIADTSTTGAFREEARQQKASADRWRLTTVVFGSIAAAVAVAAVVLAELDPTRATSTSTVVAKLTVTLVAAGVAAYAGRQSGRHRIREEEAKRLELELVAFPPFIESLSDDQKREVRKDFAERAFPGRSVEPAGEGRRLFRKEDSLGIGGPELLQLLIEVLTRDKKAQP